MNIITTPDPRLRERSTKIHTIGPEEHELIAAMRENCQTWEKSHPHELSAAMAAPQLGVNKRIIIVREDMEDKAKDDFIALINPEVIKTDGKTVRDFEGCLSVPKIYAKVPRPDKVKIKALLEDGTEVRIKADGFLARTLLHEIDHLDGILFIDRVRDDRDAFFVMNDKGDLDPVDYDQKIAGNLELFPDWED